MKDIKGAILAAQEYIDNYNPVGKSIYEYLVPFGYTNLEEFFRDKVDYEIAQLGLELVECGIEDGFDMIMEHIKNKVPGAFISTKEERLDAWIYTGKNKMYLNEANASNYLIKEFDYNGGPIISTKDDFSFVLIVPKYIDLTKFYIHNKKTESQKNTDMP